jgi:Tfp pilus assembly protein PilX
MNVRPAARAGRVQRGVSLIEALAALAVMGFGLLGVVGMQATLRTNADVSKQRSEAVRIGQAQVEDWRAFERVAAGTGTAFADIAAAGPAAAASAPNRNTAYTIAVGVDPTPLPADAPKLKSLTVDVAWTDRTDQAHTVRLATRVAGIAPELAGSLSLPTDRSAAQRPRLRNTVIPPAAVEVPGTGTSEFLPPGGGGTRWVFNNVTGLITSICAPSSPCVPTDRFLLSGFIRFATGGDPANASELPPDPPPAGLTIGVEVLLTYPSTATETCHTESSGSLALAYYCAVPVSTTAPRLWSGRSELTGLPLAATMASTSASHYKVCRYTPLATHTPPTNRDHPYNYGNVSGPLVQQNFLVIRAGSGSSAWDCPGDGPATFSNTHTYRHQPVS